MLSHPPLHDARGARAFTLIELLVVVAIISILASIAVPNFLEAQTRAKTSRIKNDMRSLAVAVESYRVDHENYPVRRNSKATVVPLFQPVVPERALRLEQMSALTSPMAYITNLPQDIFETNIEPPNNVIDYFDPAQASWLMNYNSFLMGHGVPPMSASDAGWILVSVGPDGFLGPPTFADGWPVPADRFVRFATQSTLFVPYDPTNGSISSGNIYDAQVGGFEGIGPIFAKRFPGSNR